MLSSLSASANADRAFPWAMLCLVCSSSLVLSLWKLVHCLGSHSQPAMECYNRVTIRHYFLHITMGNDTATKLPFFSKSLDSITLPALQKNFVNIFFVSAWEFCIEKWRGFWWICSGLRLPRNEARKVLGENSERNSGQNSGRKFEKFGKLSFCSFSDLTF